MLQRRPRRSQGGPSQRRAGRAALTFVLVSVGAGVFARSRGRGHSSGAAFVQVRPCSNTKVGDAAESRAHRAPAAAVPDAFVEDLLSAASAGLLPGERYVAMDRFAVRDDAGPRFEQRWASRKSTLLDLDGFRWFSLLRRVPPSVKEADCRYPDDYNYVSCTIWEGKQNFNAWRKSPAFKEAHGSGSALGFLGTVAHGLMTNQALPKPALWNGLLVEKAADQRRLLPRPGAGEGPLEPDVFVSMNRFPVVTGRENDFEDIWARRESRLRGLPGFRAFQMLRRDQVPDDDINYISMAVWDNRAAFDSWRSGEGFKQAHKRKDESKKIPPSEGPMGGVLKRPPQPYFYEGVLAVESEQGV